MEQNNLSQNISTTFNKLLTSLELGSKSGAYTLDEAYVIFQSCDTMKQFVEKYILNDSPLETDYNLENLNNKMNSLLLGLEKACKHGSYNLAQAAESKVVYVQLLQYIKEKLDKEKKRREESSNVNSDDDMTMKN